MVQFTVLSTQAIEFVVCTIITDQPSQKSSLDPQQKSATCCSPTCPADQLGKQGQECVLVFQGANYKGECALSSRPPDEEED